MVSVDDVILDHPDGGILNIIVHANSRKNEFFISIFNFNNIYVSIFKTFKILFNRFN
jgi:hypothetical protein